MSPPQTDRPFPARLRLQQAWREIGAGAMASVIALPICVSTGVLAYEPLGHDYLGQGAAIGIAAAVIGGLAGALARTSSFIPNLPSAPMALIQASFAAGLVAELGDPRAALLVLPVVVILAGLCQALIGAAGIARIVKFTPYPVLAGFVTGLSVLTLINQLPHLLGAASLAALGRALAAGTLPAPAQPAFGLILVALMLGIQRRKPRWPHLVVGLVAGTLLFHLAGRLWPQLDLGTTIGAFSLAGAGLGFHTDLATLQQVAASPTLLKSLILTALTIAILGTLDISFAQRAAQRLADIDVAPRRNVLGQGVSNVLSAMTGGVPVSSSLSFGTTIFRSGGRTRLATIAMALTLLVAALVAARLVAALPIVVLAAILATIALTQWDRWCLTLAWDVWRTRDSEARSRARRNALIVAAVMAATILGQPVVGAAFGVALSCLVFIAEMSRPIIRRELDGTQVASKRVRAQHDRAILAEHGRRTIVLELDGVLFFGNADDLAARVRALEGRFDCLILDLHRVTDLDVSGASVLQQLADRCRGGRTQLLTAGAGAKHAAQVEGALGRNAHRRVFPDLDCALEHAENLILHATAARRASAQALRLDQTDLGAGLSERELAALREHLSPFTAEAGAVLCHAGEPADRMWIITCGSVSIRVAGARHERRIAALGPGTSVGELGLLDRQPRSADVVADEDVQGFVLSAEDFGTLLREEPHLGQSLLATIARLTAQRLRATSDELRLAEV